MLEPFLDKIKLLSLPKFVLVLALILCLGLGCGYYVRGLSVSNSCTQNVVSDSSEIAVDLSGAVKNPGVYKVNGGSRISDLVTMGGGLLSSASVKNISKEYNLAEAAKDGQKIYIPFDWETPQTVTCAQSLQESNSSASNDTPGQTTSIQPTNTDEALYHVNEMTITDLDALPGIGPTYAKYISDGTPYTNYDDLVARSKVPAKTLEKFKNLLVFD